MLDVDFTKKLGEFELKVKFAITSEKLAILGSSGCGKSMTLKCIAGIEKPDSGRIVLNDRVLYDSSKGINLPPQKRRVGYLFQNYALFPNMTVAQNIGFALERKTDSNNIVKEFIQKLRLQGLENKYPAQLSGGQQQRTALARMLALDTEMIMFDEPLSALDSFLKWELEQELLDIFAGFDRPILYVSHDRGEVFRLCDHIVILDKGEIVSKSTKHALFENPKTVTGTILTGCKNISPAFCRGNGVAIAEDWGVGFRIPQGIDEEKVRFVAVRAHLMMPGSEYENIYNAQIVNVIEDVFNWIVILKLSPQAKKCFRWVVSKKEIVRLAIGTNITVGIASEQVILLES